MRCSTYCRFWQIDRQKSLSVSRFLVFLRVIPESAIIRDSDKVSTYAHGQKIGYNTGNAALKYTEYNYTRTDAFQSFDLSVPCQIPDIWRGYGAI